MALGSLDLHQGHDPHHEVPPLLQDPHGYDCSPQVAGGHPKVGQIAGGDSLSLSLVHQTVIG